MRALPLLLVCGSLVLVAACAAAGGSSDAAVLTPDELAREAGVGLTVPPYDSVVVEWKERVTQPYVYLEHRGAPETFGDTMRALLEHAVRERVETNGPLFALFPANGLSRACLPVAANPGTRGLPYDVLPKAMVAYAVVQGPYPTATHALPGLRQAMAQRGWAERGPVRAVYLVNPALATSYNDLATELQIPWASTQ
jgi:effector-binding domain-containing protein